MEPSQKAENNIYLVKNQGSAHNSSQPQLTPYGTFHGKNVSAHFGSKSSYCLESKFFSNPLRTRKACVVFSLQQSDFAIPIRAVNVFDLYAKQGGEILEFKTLFLRNLKPLPKDEVVRLGDLIDFKVNPAFRERSLSVPDQVKLQAQTNAFFDSIISSIVKQESVLLMRQLWESMSKSWGVYEIYAVWRYILGGIFGASESQ
ncbi:MAG: hypothetical protein LBK24_03060 [Puniceicoccales bacterium]|jgi:hypothetical protein|nr:hypothetical protein [Puniceicoccales bacterium]